MKPSYAYLLLFFLGLLTGSLTTNYFFLADLKTSLNNQFQAVAAPPILPPSQLSLPTSAPPSTLTSNSPSPITGSFASDHTLEELRQDLRASLKQAGAKTEDIENMVNMLFPEPAKP